MPIVHGLKNEFRGDVYVELVNTDHAANRELVSRYAASAIPLIVIFNDQGEISSKYYGYINRQALRRALTVALAESTGEA